MNPILIVAYPQRIADQQADLDFQIEYFQAIYDKFASINVTVTLDEINNQRHIVLHNYANALVLEDFVANKMIEKTGAPTLNGVPIKPERIRDMISIPDPQFIRTFIQQYNLQRVGDVNAALSPNLLEIDNGVVQRKATTNDLIEAKYSEYTQNDKGVQTFNLLDEWNDNVTAFNARLAAVKATFKIPPFSMTETAAGLRPNVDLIRANEAKYPGDYVAE